MSSVAHTALPADAQSRAQLQALPSLARLLVQHGKITQNEAAQIARQAVAERGSFIDAFINVHAQASPSLALFLSETLNLPYLDIAACDAQRLPKNVLDEKLSRAARVVVLAKRSNRLVVAISDPTQTEVLDQIKFQTQLGLDVVVAAHDKVGAALRATGQSAGDYLDTLGAKELDVALEPEANAIDLAANAEIEDAPIVRFLQKILLDAISIGASDLHFEPFETSYRIRMRLDGVLQELANPPLALKDKISTRIKVVSKLDISEKRVPQDGRMKLAMPNGRAIDFRVSTLPTLFGEKIVMRILDSNQAKFGIDSLGYEPEQQTLLLAAIKRPYGMVLVTGPTGSGKTISLYTYLNILNQPGVNISTAEDPAEINLPGVNQVNVNDKAGLNFANALRAFLRQDPDIIMVGEIRDLETADIAIKAAQTGHMVFSTVHTNDAPGTLTRLMNMGVAPFNIASSVIMIVAQRLARKLCSCKKPAEIPYNSLLEAGFEAAEIGTWKPYQAVGCELCKGTGYKGRVGIFQVMPITEAIEKIILSHGTEIDIKEQAAREGVRTLRQSGLVKVRTGITSLEEVLAVTNT